jgi:hypothetical protein
MPMICMVGPNAIGKTTAVERWSKRYGDKLTAISCDNQRVIVGESVTKELGWSGTAAEKQALVNKYRDLPQVTLIESARTDIVRFLHGQGNLLVVTCEPAEHRRHLQARCARSNKLFREDYWTFEKCRYESTRRYVNSANTNFHPRQVKIIELKTYDDWSIVDTYFYSLFRSLYNSTLKAK